jgi:hypothetical protein
MVWSPSGSGNVHVDEVLTQISIGYPNLGTVGDVLFPSVGVTKQSNKYYVFGREAWLPEGDVRAPGTVANEIPGYALSTDSYYANEHSLQTPVTDEERTNADVPLEPDQDATELVTNKIILGREVAVKTLATTAANYATGMTVTLGSGARFDSTDYATSDPIGVIKTGIRAIHAKIFMEPNVAVIPYLVISWLEDHPDLIERIKYSERAVLNADIIASMFGLPRVIVPGLGLGAGNPGQTMTVGYLWGDDIVLAWVPPRPGRKMPAYGYEFTWGRQVVDRWREEPRKSDLIRCCRYYDLKMTALDGSSKQIAGYLIKDVLT